MFIDTEHNIILFRSRKTGSTSINKYLCDELKSNPKYKKLYIHSTPKDIKNLLNLNHFKKILTVRNPYTTIISRFWYTRNQKGELDNLSEKQIMKKFDNFLANLEDRNKEFYNYEYDFIIHLEEIYSDLYKIMNYLGKNTSVEEIKKKMEAYPKDKMKRTYQSKKFELKKYFNSSNKIKKVKSMFKDYFERFGYSNELP